MEAAAAVQETALGEIGWRPFEEVAGGSVQPGHLFATVAFKEEGGRAPRGVIAALVFGLDDERAAPGRDLGAEAGAGDPAADYDDVE